MNFNKKKLVAMVTGFQRKNRILGPIHRPKNLKMYLLLIAQFLYEASLTQALQNERNKIFSSNTVFLWHMATFRLGNYPKIQHGGH